MEQGFSCSTSAFRNTNILEGIRPKKNRCNLEKMIKINGFYKGYFTHTSQGHKELKQTRPYGNKTT